MLRRILGPKRDEVTEGWGRLHNDGLGRVMVQYEWKLKDAYIVFMCRPEWKIPLGRIRRRWEGIIKIYLEGIWFEGVNCKHLTEDRVQWRVLGSTVMNLWALWNTGNFSSRWATINFSRRLSICFVVLYWIEHDSTVYLKNLFQVHIKDHCHH